MIEIISMSAKKYFIDILKDIIISKTIRIMILIYYIL